MNATPTWDDLSPGDALAIHNAADRLVEEFGAIIGKATIELFLRTSYEQFAAHATLTHFLPLMSERYTRQHLQALAKVQGSHGHGQPIVLFLDVHNSYRSQLAMGWFNHLAPGRAVAWSGGSEPATEIDPAAIAAMAEIGIDITAEFPKPWTDEIVQAADIIITMAGPQPTFNGKRHEEWDIAEPAGVPDAARSIRDELAGRVRALLAELGLSPRDPIAQTVGQHALGRQTADRPTSVQG